MDYDENVVAMANAAGPATEARPIAEAREATEPHDADVECPSCVTCTCGVAPKCDEDGCCATCGGICVAIAAQGGEPHAAPFGLDDEERAEAERLIAEFKAMPPRAVADLSDDEIVGAVAAFGPEGFDIEDTFEGSETDTLMQRLGMERDWDEDDFEDRVEKPLFARLHAMPERVTVNWHGDRMRLTWAEWGRRIEAALADGPRDIAGTVARLLEGERGDASSSGPTARADVAPDPECPGCFNERVRRGGLSRGSRSRDRFAARGRRVGLQARW